MHHPGPRSVGRALLVVVLLLAGCGGGGGGTAGDTTVSDPASTDGQTTVTDGSGTSAKAQKVRVERPSGTPLGEVIPPGDDAYLLLSTGRCSELLARTGSWRQGGDNQVDKDAFFLYRAAAEACLGRWDDAQRDFQRLQGVGPDFSGGCNSTNCERCMRAVLEWLTQILAIRRQDTTSEVELVRGTKASPCPAPGNGTPDDEETTTSSTDEETTTSRPGSTSTTEP